MNEYQQDSLWVRLREILRWWPLVLFVTLCAVGCAIWSQSRQTPSYTATTTLSVVPIAQWDETFLGTSLVRDSGDATRTAATAAAGLNTRRAATVAADYLGSGWTPDSVAAAVKVSAAENTNVIEVVAQSDDADKAVKLAEGFADATLADRWKTISAELDTRIALIDDAVLVAGPNADQLLARLQTLKMVRATGSDPTVTIDSTSLAVLKNRMPVWAFVGLAAAGGLCIGVLAAILMARLPRRIDQSSREAPLPGTDTACPPLPAPTRAYSPNGGSGADAEADEHSYPLGSDERDRGRNAR
jgi:capsular polysaccharide biosynthesis protein